MTLDEIAYNIKNLVSGGIHGEDSNISLRQIKAMIHYHRAQLLLKYTDSGRYLSEKLYSYKRSAITDGYIDLPEMVGFPNNRALVSCTAENASQGASTNLSFSTSIPVFNEEDAKFHMHSRFMNDKIMGVIDGDLSRLRFFQEGEPSSGYVVMIKYIAAKPADDDMGYPLPDELVAILTETILAKEFQIMLNVGNDIKNNTIDDRVPAGPSASSRRPKEQADADAHRMKSRRR